jgi:sarcosine oxidase
MPSAYQVIVLGLGAMGSAAVYQLAKRGVRVLGFDQFDPPHNFGSSHGDTRITRKAIGEGPVYSPLSLRSYEIFSEIEKQVGEELLRITGGLMISSDRRTGTAHVANFFSQTLQAAKQYNIKHEVFTAEDMRKRFPQFAVKSDELGYYEYDAGFLRPEKCVRAQLDLAKANGAEIHTGEKVLEIRESDGGVCVRTAADTYTAKQAIVSAGSWLTQLIGDHYEDYFKVTRQALFWFDIENCYEQFVPPKFPVFIWETQGAEGMYGIPAVDGPRGGVKMSSSAYMQRTSPDEVARTVSPEEIETMYKLQIAPFFPLVGKKCIKSAVCLYTRTETAQFVIDRLHPSGSIIVCSACSGHGFKHSAAIGEALAQLATDGASTIDLSTMTFDRLPVLVS